VGNIDTEIETSINRQNLNGIGFKVKEFLSAIGQVRSHMNVDF